MKIDSLINSDLILDDLKGTSVSGCLYEMLIQLESVGVLTDKSKALVELIDREAQSSTVLLPEVAFPHIYCDDIQVPIISIGRSKNGIDFKSVYGEKIHCIFLILMPTEKEYLWIFKELLGKLSQKKTIGKIKDSFSSDEIAMNVKGIAPLQTNISIYKEKEIYNERAD